MRIRFSSPTNDRNLLFRRASGSRNEDDADELTHGVPLLGLIWDVSNRMRLTGIALRGQPRG